MMIRAEISYPGATPEQAYALSIDPQFRAAVCEATDALDHDVSVDEHDDGTSTVVVNRTMPADVPDFIKKMIGDTVDIVQSEEWGEPDGAGQRTADLVVQIKGQPAKMTGTTSIVTTGEGTAIRIEGNLKVSIPFVGSKVEPEIAKSFYAAIQKEQETGTSWLD